MSGFLFVLCQHGAEKALKGEVERSRPDLKAAYQRPGLVTFKSTRPLTPEDSVDAVLGRLSGQSLGTFKDLAAAVEKLGKLAGPFRLHVIERDLFRPDEAPPSHKASVLASETEQALRGALPGVFSEGSVALEGEVVLDVVVAPNDPMLLGLHRHTKAHSPHPGGRYLYDIPEGVPSRAYQKTEEAIRAFALPLVAGETAVELGAAPGGGALALLGRGLKVVAIDPADMDSKVAGKPGLTHVRLPMQRVERNLLPESVEWLFMDVNLAPQVALRAAARYASMFKRSLKGAVLTLKLNDWSFLESLPGFLAQAREMGLVEPRARQLPAHRQEIVLVGLTSAGALAADQRARKS
jgi:23S rRNA (cytidine2498-2'-O)-methyltransferase